MSTAKIRQWAVAVFFVFAGAHAWPYGTGTGVRHSGAIPHTGTVLETMSTAGYTYVRVDEEGRAFWIALPETQVSVGETISFYEQMLMEDFRSPSLNRTFDRILFVEAISKDSQLPTASAAKPSPNRTAPNPNVD